MATPTPSADDAPAVAVDGLRFAYGSEAVLDGVAFSIARREAVCIVGPNGGGKTTLVRLMLGLLKPSSGVIRMLGLPPCQASLRIGYMPQHLAYDPKFPVTALDIVIMGRLGKKGLSGLLGRYSAADREAARDKLALMGIDALANRSFGELSGGQRQRVLIARALCSDPELLLLDEPTANVDTALETRLMDILQELNRQMTVIVVSHDLGVVSRLARRVICVNRRVSVHPTSELTGGVIRDLYGGEVRAVRHDGPECGGCADA